LLTREFSTPKFVVSGLLPSGSLSILWGSPGIGKTYLCIDMAISIARGEPFLGLSTTRGEVLYYCLEGGERGFKDRLLKRAERSFPGLKVCFELAFRTDKDWDDFQRDCAGKVLVVIDPVLAVHLPTALKINDNDTVAPFLQRLNSVAPSARRASSPNPSTPRTRSPS